MYGGYHGDGVCVFEEFFCRVALGEPRSWWGWDEGSVGIRTPEHLSKGPGRWPALTGRGINKRSLHLTRMSQTKVSQRGSWSWVASTGPRWPVGGHAVAEISWNSEHPFQQYRPEISFSSFSCPSGFCPCSHFFYLILLGLFHTMFDSANRHVQASAEHSLTTIVMESLVMSPTSRPP